MNIKESDIAGLKYGRLTVIKEVNPRKRSRVFQCECSCGKTKDINMGSLRGGLTKSCGCLRDEINTKRETKHGLRYQPMYGTYNDIKARCLNKKRRGYAGYGGRGIKIHSEWEDSPKSFFDYIASELGERPEGQTLDRINNDGNYEPGNLKWSTPRQQCNNQRTNKHITFNGETLTMAQWSRRTNIRKDVIAGRLRYGWSVERALTTPASKLKRKNTKKQNR